MIAMDFLHLPFKKLALLLLLLLGACSGEAPPSAPHTVHVLLVDISGVREDPQVRERYAHNAREVVDKMAEGDRLKAYVISDRSVNEGGDLATLELPVFTPGTDNDMIVRQERKRFQAKLEELKAGVIGELENFILKNERISPRTELIGALHRAGTAFQKDPDAQHELVILSDMEEVSDHYNFTREHLDDTRTQAIIEAERNAASGLPPLKDVRVKVMGAHSANQDRYFTVRNFWAAFFKASGAELDEGDYE